MTNVKFLCLTACAVTLLTAGPGPAAAEDRDGGRGEGRRAGSRFSEGQGERGENRDGREGRSIIQMRGVNMSRPERLEPRRFSFRLGKEYNIPIPDPCSGKIEKEN